MDRLHQRRAEGVWRRALQDVEEGRLQRRDVSILAGRLLAVAILLVPPLFALAGLALLWFTWPGILGIALSVLLLLVAVVLWPRPPKLPDRLVRRVDAPETFALFDRIGAALGAPPVTALAIDDDFNARAMQARGELVIGMGGILWQASTPRQRIAVLAHEMGHHVNGDPSRGRLIGSAFYVLDRWHELCDPSGGWSDSLAGELVQVPLTFAIELAEVTLRRATYGESQRAEYLADALASRVAGPDAMREALNLLLLAPVLDARLGDFYGPSTPKGVDWFDAVAKGLLSTSTERWDALREKAEAERHTVDQSHPPTIYRLYFLEELPPADIEISADWSAIEAEWAPHLTRLGDRWYSRYQAQ